LLTASTSSGAKTTSPEEHAALNASYWFGIRYGSAAIKKAVEPNDTFGLRTDQKSLESYAKKLGVHLVPLPNLKGRTTSARAHVQMIELHFAGPMQKMARQIETKHGKDCSRIFLWAGVIAAITPPLPHPCLPARMARDLAERYTVKAGLPRELALPLLKAVDGENLRITATRCGTRTKFYIDRVLSGKEKLAVLADPAFDTKQETALTNRLAREKDARLDKLLALEKDPDKRTDLLLQELDYRDGKDPNDKIGSRLRELGAGTLPTLCRHLLRFRGRQLEVNPAAQAALDVVAFGRTFAEVESGVSREMVKA
jgi:hypothetical protein